MEFSQSRTKHLLKRLSMFLSYILVAYVLLFVLVRLCERRLIFFPDYPGRLEGDWHPRNLAPEDVWITAADGTRLHAGGFPMRTQNSLPSRSTGTLPISPIALPPTNFCATRPQTSLRWNIAATATAKANLLKPASTYARLVTAVIESLESLPFVITRSPMYINVPAMYTLWGFNPETPSSGRYRFCHIVAGV